MIVDIHLQNNTKSISISTRCTFHSSCITNIVLQLHSCTYSMYVEELLALVFATQHNAMLAVHTICGQLMHFSPRQGQSTGTRVMYTDYSDCTKTRLWQCSNCAHTLIVCTYD